MSSSSRKQSVALSSVFASALLTVTKLIAGLITGSMGIISEALHSLLDLGAAALTYFAVRVGDKPADPEHPYGHGKVESVSALIESALLFLTSFWIIYEAIKRLIYTTGHIEVKWYSFAVIILSIVVDISRSRALGKVAKETNSQALEADALHFSSDIWSSAVVMLGLILALFGVNRADSIAAICVAIFVLYAGYRLSKRTIDVLIDATPQGLREKIIDLTNSIEGVIGIEKLRVRPVGPAVFIDMIITISRKTPLERAHEIAKAVEDKIRASIPETDIIIHTKPLALNTETIIEQVRIVAENHNLAVHDIAVHEESNKKHVDFDLEIEKKSTIKQAHDIASHLEHTLKDEIGSEVEFNTHLEPLNPVILKSKKVMAAEETKIKEKIQAIAKQLPLIKEVHKIKILKVKEKLFISLHAVFEDHISLEKTHLAASQYEHLIRDEFPMVERAVVHMEPMSAE